MPNEINVMGGGPPAKKPGNKLLYLLLIIPVVIIAYFLLPKSEADVTPPIPQTTTMDSTTQTDTAMITDPSAVASQKVTQTTSSDSSKNTGVSNGVKPSLYRVKPGDCLWNIAKSNEAYGDPFMWTKIYEANKDKINDPSVILTNSELIIP